MAQLTTNDGWTLRTPEHHALFKDYVRVIENFHAATPEAEHQGMREWLAQTARTHRASASTHDTNTGPDGAEAHSLNGAAESGTNGAQVGPATPSLPSRGTSEAPIPIPPRAQSVTTPGGPGHETPSTPDSPTRANSPSLNRSDRLGRRDRHDGPYPSASSSGPRSRRRTRVPETPATDVGLVADDDEVTDPDAVGTHDHHQGQNGQEVQQRTNSTTEDPIADGSASDSNADEEANAEATTQANLSNLTIEDGDLLDGELPDADAAVAPIDELVRGVVEPGTPMPAANDCDEIRDATNATLTGQASDSDLGDADAHLESSTVAELEAASAGNVRRTGSRQQATGITEVASSQNCANGTRSSPQCPPQHPPGVLNDQRGVRAVQEASPPCSPGQQEQRGQADGSGPLLSPPATSPLKRGRQNDGEGVEEQQSPSKKSRNTQPVLQEEVKEAIERILSKGDLLDPTDGLTAARLLQSVGDICAELALTKTQFELILKLAACLISTSSLTGLRDLVAETTALNHLRLSEETLAVIAQRLPGSEAYVKCAEAYAQLAECERQGLSAGLARMACILAFEDRMRTLKQTLKRNGEAKASIQAQRKAVLGSHTYDIEDRDAELLLFTDFVGRPPTAAEWDAQRRRITDNLRRGRNLLTLEVYLSPAVLSILQGLKSWPTTLKDVSSEVLSRVFERIESRHPELQTLYQDFHDRTKEQSLPLQRGLYIPNGQSLRYQTVPVAEWQQGSRMTLASLLDNAPEGSTLVPVDNFDDGLSMDDSDDDMDDSDDDMDDADDVASGPLAEDPFGFAESPSSPAAEAFSQAPRAGSNMDLLLFEDGWNGSVSGALDVARDDTRPTATSTLFDMPPGDHLVSEVELQHDESEGMDLS